MEAGEASPALPQQLLEHGLELIGIKAEFAVEMSGADVFVGVAFDARGEPQHQLGRRTIGRHEFSQAFEVVLVVNDDRHPVVEREQQLFVVFVVAVQHHAFTGHAALKRRQQFTG